MQVELQPLWPSAAAQHAGVQRRAERLDLRVAFARVAQAADVEPVAGGGTAHGFAT